MVKDGVKEFVLAILFKVGRMQVLEQTFTCGKGLLQFVQSALHEVHKKISRTWNLLCNLESSKSGKLHTASVGSFRCLGGQTSICTYPQIFILQKVGQQYRLYNKEMWL